MRIEPKKTRVDHARLREMHGQLAEGVILVDTSGAIVWANAASLHMHGCTRVAQLGGDAGAYRRRFVLCGRDHRALPAKLYPLVRLVAGESFADVIVEVTHRGHGSVPRVQSRRSLRLTDAQGGVEFLALIIEDITEKIGAEEQFESAFAANPAPAVILRLRDSRYIKANAGFLEMTGFDRAEVIDRPFHEIDVLRRADHRTEALVALREHRTIVQQESRLRLKDGVHKFVIVAGHPIDVSAEPCMLFTFIDLDGRKRAELALSESEERFEKAFRLAPVPMLICATRDGRVMEVNDAFVRIAGYPRAAIVGQSLVEAGLQMAARSMRALLAGLDRDAIRDRDIQLRTREGATIDCLLLTEPVTIQGHASVLCVVQDVTERRRSEAELIAAIEAVMKDASWFSRTVMEKLAQMRHPGSSSGQLGALTPRELDVLELICSGKTDVEIAAALKLSRNTVRNHVASLYAKIDVNRRSAAVVWGRERGLAAF
ncbi:MAG: PAS domain S-box protein [Rhodanobacteraceae bacterium]